MHRLARDHPSHHGGVLAHMPVEIFGRQMVQVPQDVRLAIEGVDGEEKAHGFDLVLEHERTGVGGGSFVFPKAVRDGTRFCNRRAIVCYTFAFTATEITIMSIITDHLLTSIRDMGAHGCKPF